MRSISSYLFDLDGTLTDARSGLHASFRAALTELGIPDLTDRQLDRFLGTPLPEMFRALKPQVSEQDIARGMRAFRSAYEVEGIMKNHLYPGVTEMLAALRKRGFAAWVVTSKPEHYAVQVVEHLGIAGHFDGVIGADLSETNTKAQLVARVLESAKIDGKEALMLGDRYYDVVGARANNVLPVGALWGYGSREELQEAGCTLFADTAEEFRVHFVDADAELSGAVSARLDIR